jgi:hypothetical protein
MDGQACPEQPLSSQGEARPRRISSKLSRIAARTTLRQRVLAKAEASAPRPEAGTDAANRLAMVVQCAAHMQHHIGQMIYLSSEFARQR